jgi:hypothetical protein
MMAAAQDASNRVQRPSTTTHYFTANFVLLLILAPASGAVPSLFKNVKPLAAQPGVPAAAAPAQQILQYALPQDVQVLSMAAPGGNLTSSLPVEYIKTAYALANVNCQLPLVSYHDGMPLFAAK